MLVDHFPYQFEFHLLLNVLFQVSNVLRNDLYTVYSKVHCGNNKPLTGGKCDNPQGRF